MENTQGYYIDQAGVICSIASPPEGCNFLFSDKSTYQEVSIVFTETCEVHDTYVLWPSLKAMEQGCQTEHYANLLAEEFRAKGFVAEVSKK